MKYLYGASVQGIQDFIPGSCFWGIVANGLYKEKSQIRTFSYSSFNGYGKSHNLDYTGIEKGSVFVLSGPEPPFGDGWIGSFRT